MTSKVKWDDPPEELTRHATGGTRGPLPTAWAEEATDLRARAGVWGLIFEFEAGARAAYNMADNVRRGRIAAFRPAGAYDARAIRGQVWVRYVEPGIIVEDPEVCDECGATMPHDETRISEAHRVTCSLHPANIRQRADDAVRRIERRFAGEQRGCRS